MAEIVGIVVTQMFEMWETKKFPRFQTAAFLRLLLPATALRGRSVPQPELTVLPVNVEGGKKIR